MEASRALGLSRTQSMRHVIVPQAIRIVLPPVGNEFIAMLKDSSLVSVLAISDLLRRGREYASRTFDYIATYTLVALIYLLVTLIFSRVVFYIEQGMSRQEEGIPVTVMHRLAGSLVDFVVIDFLALPIWGLAQALLPEGANAGPIILAVMGVLAIVYTLFFWTRIGRTPGMMAVGLRLIDREGNIPTLSRAVQRLLIAFLPLPGLSYLGILRPLGGYPLQDRFTRTFVVRS
jgi:uncharacterized RDD family membrane protein YckC